MQVKDTIVLGYSGFNDYNDYKKSHIEGLTLHESLVSQGMDAAAAIIRNGTIIAAVAEERFTGQKHTSAFPKNAIEYCLSEAGVEWDDITAVAHNFDYRPMEALLLRSEYTKDLYKEVLSDERQIALFKETFGIDVSDRFTAVDHHISHASYAFYNSAYEKSLVVVADGLGEQSSISIYNGRGNQLEKLAALGPLSSLGMLYSAVTDYLGFITNSDEYKIMGLAAYGNPEVYADIFEKLVVLDDRGGVLIPDLLPRKIETPVDRETYRHFKNVMQQLGLPAREPEGEVTQAHRDFTAALQRRLNDAMLHVVSYWAKETGNTNLCMSGGVALNCVANAYIADKKMFKSIYVAPAAADDGTSIGAALHVSAQQDTAVTFSNSQDMPFYGPSVTVTPEIEARAKEYGFQVRHMSQQELITTVRDCIVNGGIVGWAQERMEFGPRALGHRSILADPRQYEMRDRLNTVTKQRENFRPFAPIVQSEALKTYFEAVDGVGYKHMLFNVNVREEHRDELQAITHVDGTARVQAVEKADLPLLWDLLGAVAEVTGAPVMLNTSFNLKSMPIVCYADDALQAYIDSDIDLLVINDTIFTKAA